ncbi:MAG: hypothetical protein QNJ06_02820 [Kiloniellales bacterium]|nr:hypothetical protein [Kiloniellales bacterium]MDJ0968807.1 hypothetical protein [Kiloniellales bacterium]
MSGLDEKPGLTARQARRVEFGIIGLCIAALVMIFQPFSLTLFGIGAALVVLGGLAFNLVPLCRPGVRASSLVKAGGIVLLILLVIAGIAISAAHLYGVYLQSQ